jgi:hypothetical protein
MKKYDEDGDVIKEDIYEEYVILGVKKVKID